MEKRMFSRVPFRIDVAVKTERGLFKGVLDDISFKGMRIVSDAEVVIGEEVKVEIELHSAEPPLHLEVQCVVQRAEVGAIAVKILQMDLETFTHLRCIVEYNSGEPEKIACELGNYIHKK